MGEIPNDKNTNINLSAAPYEKAVDTLAQAAVKGAESFLSSVCLPALQEVGGIVSDRAKMWRASQRLKLIQRWEAKMAESGSSERLHAPPRLIATGLDRGSLVDSEELQALWAGLLASSCTREGKDDSNLLSMSILDQLTVPEARILNYACEQAEKKISPYLGLIYTERLEVTLDELVAIAGVDDVQRLDRELDHLRELGLLDNGGFSLIKPENLAESVAVELIKNPRAEIKPSAQAIHFYVRCQGSLLSPSEYFGLATPAFPSGSGGE